MRRKFLSVTCTFRPQEGQHSTISPSWAYSAYSPLFIRMALVHGIGAFVSFPDRTEWTDNAN